MPAVNRVVVKRQVQALELAVDTAQQAGPPYLIWGDNVTLALNRLQVRGACAVHPATWRTADEGGCTSCMTLRYGARPPPCVASCTSRMQQQGPGLRSTPDKRTHPSRL